MVAITSGFKMPFEYQTICNRSYFDHCKSSQIRISDPHCNQLLSWLKFFLISGGPAWTRSGGQAAPVSRDGRISQAAQQKFWNLVPPFSLSTRSSLQKREPKQSEQWLDRKCATLRNCILLKFSKKNFKRQFQRKLNARITTAQITNLTIGSVKNWFVKNEKKTSPASAW